MSDPTYEAIRARERAEAEEAKLHAELKKAAARGFIDFMNGKARIDINVGQQPWQIRFVRDDPPAKPGS